MGLDFDYDDDYCRERECYKCDEKDSQLEDVKYWLQAIVDHLYSEEIVYADDFERCLEELCCCVKIRLPDSPIKFQKVVSLPIKVDPSNRQFDLDWWKTWNHQELKKLSHS